jgi:cytochrome b6-f complex iron-sulfur subunit
MSKNLKEKKSKNEPSRRSFLNNLWLSLGVIALAEFVWLVIAFLRPRKPRAKEGDFGTLIEAGSVDSFTSGTVTAFPRGHFYLARLEDGGFLAISRTCTHLGCTVPWVEKEKNFACPCHASTFDISGDVINSPAPRALDIFQIFIENNVVKVNTSKRIKRGEFRISQVTYAKNII